MLFISRGVWRAFLSATMQRYGGGNAVVKFFEMFFFNNLYICSFGTI
jgi:hypothetical protein